MYSLLPAAVSILFLGYGVYVLAVKRLSKVTLSFFALCATTFLWQFNWAFLFQVQAPEQAAVLVKLGYLAILFLPTTYYHFFAAVSRKDAERRLVRISYAFAATLAAILLTTELVVDGYHSYFWGYYPKAGPLHPLHVLQTLVVAARSFYITYRASREAVAEQRARLRLCMVSLGPYPLAALDYLCNYGYQLYPLGAVFLAMSLGLTVVAITKYDLLGNPMQLAASMAHEIRTPLASIRAQALIISRYLPILFEGYQRAVESKAYEPRLRRRELEVLEALGKSIELEVDRSTVIVDLMLASSRMDLLDRSNFKLHSLRPCLDEALRSYPFPAGMRERVRIVGEVDFRFFGSDVLLVYVLYNLLKNACYAIKAVERGEIQISAVSGPKGNSLIFTDTGAGIPAQVLPHIFDPFYTTKTSGSGTGIGLTFCQRVMSAFGGRISCRSEEGRYTSFYLDFPLPRPDEAVARNVALIPS